MQAEILKLMRDLRDRIDAGVILITHDMGVVADLSDRVIVMQRGRIVESGTADQVFNAPEHPYTQQLLAAVPHLGSRSVDEAGASVERERRRRASRRHGRRRRRRASSSTCATSPSSTPSAAGRRRSGPSTACR